jgi:phosphoribosylaminoimidazole-succinocarboxamide synthase
MQVLRASRLNLHPDQKFYEGKVRDVYWIGDRIILVASDRISAFDHILHEAIPYKGQVLNQVSAFFLEKSKAVVPNWFESSPDPNVSMGKACEPIRLEMVVRAYLAGHAWRLYRSGEREICGVTMPEGMKENDAFPTPIITPASKAEEGHDEDISREQILKQTIVSPEVYTTLEDYSLELFDLGTKMAREQGLILVDTKYEFGLSAEGEVLLMDEVHTPDSSRYFYLEGYEERQKRGERQKQLSKEFVREWLIEQGFQGKEGQVLPNLAEDFVQQISERYIELYETITGQKFVKASTEDINQRIQLNLEKVV